MSLRQTPSSINSLPDYDISTVQSKKRLPTKSKTRKLSHSPDSIGSTHGLQDLNDPTIWDTHNPSEFDKLNKKDRIAFLNKVIYKPHLIKKDELLKFYDNIIKDHSIDLDLNCDDILREILRAKLMVERGVMSATPSVSEPGVHYNAKVLRRIIKKHTNDIVTLNSEYDIQEKKHKICNDIMVDYITKNKKSDPSLKEIDEIVELMLFKEIKALKDGVKNIPRSSMEKPIQRTSKYRNLHTSTSLGGKNKTQKNQKK